MFKPRLITTAPDWQDADGIKLYHIAAEGCDVLPEESLIALNSLKQQRNLDWSATPAFCIFHAGRGMDYVVLCHWGNDNELFPAVSVRFRDAEPQEWQQDPGYSFCLWDMEVMWAERNFYIASLYSATVAGQPSGLEAYRRLRLIKDNA
ncbi:hypothetical protein ACKC9G_02255 [Pokkaliibacter sp. CJK22405]|uniref:hypothetical protein n=1 Tax=Pokkaliibacter sp. CJK22405 TaxID=3384615 RepID=UPI00398476B0